MPRRPSEPLTEREAQIMSVLWDQNEATADDIRARLPDEPHDSTVRTLLRVLEKKGYVRHKARGKAYVYTARIPRENAERKAVSTMLERFFGGSAAALVQRLIDDERLTPEDLEVLRQQADAIAPDEAPPGDNDAEDTTP